MPSARLQSLDLQVKNLKKHFLPSRFSKIGYYYNTDRVSIRALSFRVMCHAEVESYLEDRCLEIAKLALAYWRAGNYSATISCITLFSGHNFSVPPDTVHPTAKDQKDWDDLVSPNQRVERAFSSYIHFVTKKNHGVREANLTALMIPLGIDLRTLSPDLISRLDLFGQNRGDAAHQSANQFLKKGVDPAGEWDEMKKILSELAALDVVFDGVAQKLGLLP